MVPFDEYVRTRGGELLRLARALAGQERLARDLVFRALADARGQWPRIEDEDPQTHIQQGIVRAYLAFWRRSQPGAADDPLARLSRPQRAALVLRLLAGLSYLEVAEYMESSPNATARLTEQALGLVDEVTARQALDGYNSVSPGTSILLQGAAAASRQRSRRRLIVAASVIGVLVAVVALARPAAKPEPQPSPTPSPTHTYVPSPVRFIPAIIPMPVFPYVATYLPEGAGQPTIHQDGTTLGMTYDNFALTVSPDQPAVELRRRVDHVWERDGRWLRIVSDRMSLADVGQVIDGLKPGDSTMTLPPFTISLMPAGYVLRRANPQSICLAATREQPASGLCVTALPDVLGQASWPVQPVTVSVQGREAHLIYPNGLWAELWIHLDESRVIRVSLEQRTPFEMLNEEDLLTFAEAILIRSP
jgi:DNA-directed RNA polymerase specialized sigma24 family protein